MSELTDFMNLPDYVTPVDPRDATIATLTAALSEARGKVGELEALREQQAAAFVKFAKDRPVAPHPVDQMENLRRAMTTDIEIEKLEAERDAALSELAKERGEADRKDHCLAFFQSVIRSGEPWTETCEREYAAATSSLPSPPKDPTHD